MKYTNGCSATRSDFIKRKVIFKRKRNHEKSIYYCTEKFDTAKWDLIREGFKSIVNPLSIRGIHFGITHEKAMELCLAELKTCTHIYLLSDWKDSKGAQMEYKFAKENGLTIMEELKFENRNNSSTPSIKRLAHKDVYIYYIGVYAGCSCDYVGCDQNHLVSQNVKVRKQIDGSIVLSKSGRTKVKLNPKKEYTGREILKIAEENYEL